MGATADDTALEQVLANGIMAHAYELAQAQYEYFLDAPAYAERNGKDDDDIGPFLDAFGVFESKKIKDFVYDAEQPGADKM